MQQDRRWNWKLDSIATAVVCSVSRPFLIKSAPQGEVFVTLTIYIADI